MGSPLPPVIANFYMEWLEHLVLQWAPLNPTHFYCYVDDTFLVWSHGRDKLEGRIVGLFEQHP